MLINIQINAECFGQSSFLRREESGSKRYPQSYHGEQSSLPVLNLAANSKSHRKHCRSFGDERIVASAQTDDVPGFGHDFKQYKVLALPIINDTLGGIGFCIGSAHGGRLLSRIVRGGIASTTRAVTLADE